MESDGFAELEWAPGSAQVDFGQARAVIAGVERVVRFLVASFPYSNMRWVVALPGETSECVCQGLLWIFGRMGMAPRVVVFDNATGVGHRGSGRHGRPDPLVLPVLRALRVRAAVPLPVFRPREGQCEERRRLRQAQPDGADAVGRELPNADARVA